ncbi:MAG: SAM-dependent methyltransferase, partial [Clostridia bacterium]|nr:SAM-dependent methyltransferase [Clostridia bacterium]
MVRTDSVNENLIIKQRSDGLLFGTDALLLASFVRRSPKAIAVEFGSGSGIISLLCAKKGFF